MNKWRQRGIYFYVLLTIVTLYSAKCSVDDGSYSSLRTFTYACSESQNQNMPIYKPATFVSPWVNCCDCRQFDDVTWALEALLRLPKSRLTRELKYKYFVHAGKGIDHKYEHLVHTSGDPGNRCLKPAKSYTWDRRGESSNDHDLTMSCVTYAILYYADSCYHHYDDFIFPKRGFWSNALKKIQGYKSKNGLRAQSLEHYLKCYTDALGDAPTLTNLLCKDIPAAIEDITCKFTHLKDGYSSSLASYSRAQPLDEGSCHKVKSVSNDICIWPKHI